MTPTVIKPTKNKINAVLETNRPANCTEVQSFIVAVNYYKFLWPRREHMLSPLGELAGTKPF